MESTDFTLGPFSATFLAGIATVFLIYWYSTRNHSYWKKKGVPHVKPYPFVGSMHENILKPLHNVDLQRLMKYGDVYGHYEGNRVMLSVADPVLLRNILVKDFNFFTGRRNIHMDNKIIGSMMSVLQGEDWKRVRTIVTPTFTTGKIKKMIYIFSDCSKALVENFKRSAEVGEPVEVKRLYGGYTMDVIVSAAFSTKIDSYNDPDNEFVKNAQVAFTGSMNWRFLANALCPTFMRLFGIPVIPPSVMPFFCSVTRQIIEERKRSGQTRNDFLQLLMDTAKEVGEDETSGMAENESKDIAENYGKDESVGDIFKNNYSKKHLSFDELVAQSVMFFLAGYETIASALSYATYLLALHEDVQNKVIAEVDQAVQDYKGELTYEAIQSMKYLDNVISETMRLYPPGIRAERVADADYKLGDTGITVTKGMIITIPIYAIHRNPNFYPDPDKFDPERFSAEERAKRNQYTYIPFGAGPRNCVAMRFALMEVKVCLAYVISNFRIKRCAQTKVPLEFRAVQGRLNPKDITLKMQLRTDCKLAK